MINLNEQTGLFDAVFRTPCAASDKHRVVPAAALSTESGRSL